jgi:hypothetical protein
MDTSQHQAATLAWFSLIESDLKYKAKKHFIRNIIMLDPQTSIVRKTQLPLSITLRAPRVKTGRN